MDAAALIASLQHAVPGVQIESAPSVDLQTDLSVSRDALELPAGNQVLQRCDERRAVHS